MRRFDRFSLMASVASSMTRVARSGTFDGHYPSAYLDRCWAYHEPTGSIVLFARDVGYHSSGWWKNPDYERCLHLSLSFRDPTSGQVAPRDAKLSREWAGLFFGNDVNLTWCEPPYSDQGKAREVWHYRLFCSPAWTPILPRGEVYSRELTEAGWKSFGDVQADLADDRRRAVERGS